MAVNKLKEKFFRKHKDAKRNNQKKLNLNIINDQTHFSITEAYKAARTNLMFTLTNETGCKRILITSSAASEGKSTTASNLAITFAQTGARVMLIEADLRRPKLHWYLELPNEAGMAEYLGGFKTLNEIIQHSKTHNLDCITGGRIPPNPSELLMSPSMETLLNELSDKYDYIFIDSPPVNVVTDPASIGRLMTGAVMVVKQNYTTSDSLRQAVATLEFGNIKILGYILNGSAELRGYSYNRYKYQYGHVSRYDYSYSYNNRYGYGQHYGSDLYDQRPKKSIDRRETEEKA